MIHNSNIARNYVLFIYLFMLYVAGFSEKNSPQVYIYAESFVDAYKMVDEWLVNHKGYTLVCINEFVTDSPIEISPNSYTVDSLTNKLIPRDNLSIYGIRYTDNDLDSEEKEKTIIAVEMGSIAYSASGIIKGLWRIPGESDIVLI